MQLPKNWHVGKEEPLAGPAAGYMLLCKNLPAEVQTFIFIGV